MPKTALFALIFALVFALIVAPACLAQTISGTVTTPMGEPVRGATLRLSSDTNGVMEQRLVYSVFSDAKGNYTFEDLAPGSYAICSDKPGYLYDCYADSAKRGVFDLAVGQKLSGIDIKMTPQAVISGRVIDENGDPLPNVQVWTARWTYAEGGRQLTMGGGGGNGASNVEGEFSIGRLKAGSYYIQVQPISVSQNATSKGPRETYPATYYPGVTDPAKAVSVQVAAGGAVRGLEIRMIKTRAYRVRGNLAGVGGGIVPPNTSVQLMPEDRGLMRFVPAIVRNGTFDFEGVLPGAYFLDVRTPTGFVHQKVTVGSTDLDDVAVQLAPGAEIAGTISIEGAPLPPQAKPIIQLGGTRWPIENGTFPIHNLRPGTYSVDMYSLPPETYIKSIRLGERDVTKAQFDLAPGASETMSIVLSPNAGEIAATVHDADGLIRPNVYVSLWTPGLPAEGGLDFTRTEVTDRDGKFKFTNLPPGDYRIAAWDEGNRQPYEAMVPEVRVHLESRAAAVKLEEGAHASVDAPLIGPDIVEAEIAKLP